jgi:hypothetical protein
MLRSLRSRNVALMAGMLFLGQLLTMVLVGVLVIDPQARRVAMILSRNVKMVGTTLDALPPQERTRFINRVNTTGTYGSCWGTANHPASMVTRHFLKHVSCARSRLSWGSARQWCGAVAAAHLSG